MAQKMTGPLNVSNPIGLMSWTRQITVTHIAFVTFTKGYQSSHDCFENALNSDMSNRRINRKAPLTKIRSKTSQNTGARHLR